MLKRIEKGIFLNTKNGRYHLRFIYTDINTGIKTRPHIVAQIKLDDGSIRYAQNKDEAKLAISQYIANGGQITQVILKKNKSLLYDCQNKYILYCKSMGKKRTDLIETYCNYFIRFLAQRDYNNNIDRAKANICISDICTNDFIEYVQHRQMTKIITKTKNGEKWTGRFVSNAAINRERNSIKGLFSYITDTLELLENNPTKKWKPLPIIEKIKPPLEIEQEQAILKLASSDIGFFTELVFLDTLGARKSEMYNLLWKHTHLESTTYFPYGYADLVNRKNGKVLRVPFSAELQTLLQNMPRCSEYVFANPNTGTRYTHRYKKLKTILEKVGVDGLGIGYHIFRHNTAANLEQNGVEASVISEILGNTSGVVRTTYLNQGIKRKQEVINLNSERIRKLTTRREKIKSVHKVSTMQII